MVPSSSQLLVISPSDEDAWNDLLAQEWKKDPNRGIHSVKHRASDDLAKNDFAAPPTLSQQVAQVKAGRAAREVIPTPESPETLRVTHNLAWATSS